MKRQILTDIGMFIQNKKWLKTMLKVLSEFLFILYAT